MCTVYSFELAVMHGRSASGEIVHDDFKTLTCSADRIASDFRSKLRELFPDIVPDKKLVIIDNKGKEVNWSWDKIGFNLVNWLKIEFSKEDQIRVFIEPSHTNNSPKVKPSALVSELVAKVNQEMEKDSIDNPITSEELVARMNQELERDSKNDSITSEELIAKMNQELETGH